MFSISLQNISFNYPMMADVFADLSVIFNDQQKVAIIGDNGSGKTTLLKIIAGEIAPSGGRIVKNATTCLLPQISAPDAKSGGERQIAALRDAFDSGADILLLDEPTNNLDATARADFFRALRVWRGGAIIVSHDRELLRQVNQIIEMRAGAIRIFGGNYDFYVAQKSAEHENLESQYANTENRIERLNKTKRIAATTANASLSRLKESKKRGIETGHKFKHGGNHPADKTETVMVKKLKLIQKKLDEQNDKRQDISEQLRDDKIKIPLPAAPFIKNDLIKIYDMDFSYDGMRQIFNGFDFQMRGGERVQIAGQNGAGKSTLIKLILGELQPCAGSVRLLGRAAYLDQNLSLLPRDKSVISAIADMAKITDREAYPIAANFGFRGSAGQKQIGVLSGGELLKATFAAVLGRPQQPDLLILDEPTNNLDIKSIDILENALNQYMGGILLISHDKIFADNIKIDRVIEL